MRKYKLCYPVIIGLCGRSGSGKGFVSGLFEKKGIPSIDTDAVYHAMTSPVEDGQPLSECMVSLINEFGQGIVSHDGSLNRKALADIVFSENGADALKRLNIITHKFILDETDVRIKNLTEQGYDIIIIDAPLLFESGYDKKCDLIISTHAPEDVLVKRIMSRDLMKREDAVRRLASQMSADEFADKSDYIINTDADAETINKDIEFIISDIRNSAEK